MLNPDTQPASPLTELAAAAVAAHEMYQAFVGAGFTEAQALQIIIAQLSNVRPPS